MALTRNDIEGLIDRLEVLRDRAREWSELFQTLDAFCLFAGYPKSGHSLVGALLDAHPDMVVAHELHCLRCLRAGLGREAILALALEMSADFHAGGSLWNGFSYRVEDQWQGRSRRLRVVGDKKGGGTSQYLLRYPHLLDRLRGTLKLPLRFIHVIRHPLDNIASMSREFGWPLEESADFYFSLAESCALLKQRIPPDSLCELHYEDFVRDPVPHLRNLCRFLGQDASADYLESCARIVTASPRPAPASPPWPGPLLGQVAELAARYEFLKPYRVDG